MTLSELADAITTGVQQTAQRDVIAGRVGQLKRIESTLDQLMPVVTEAVSLVGAAAASGLSIDAERLASLGGRISDATVRADQLEVDGPALERLAMDVRTEAASVKSAATGSWRELVDRRIPQRQGLTALANTYLQLDPGDTLAQQLRQAVVAAQQLANMPPSIEALQRLDQLAAQIPQLSRDLVGDAPSVRSFIERVARGGAALDSLTPEVGRWIESKRFEGVFKIVLGEPES
jgi:hypothetical protein